MFNTFAFPDMGIFKDFKRERNFEKFKKEINPFSSYFYEETRTELELYYISEELEIKGEKIIRLIGFVNDFDLAKNLVKELNNQSSSFRFDFNKIKLMNKDSIDSILKKGD